MTTARTVTIKNKADRIDEFITKLDSLVRQKDRAKLAALRHLSAQPSRWGPQTYAAGVPLLPYAIRSDDDDKYMFVITKYLFVAGLYALWHRGRSEPSKLRNRDFGASMRKLATKDDPQGRKLSQAVERRFSALLASDDERLFHHLRQSIDQLASARIEVDFGKLLEDLFSWDNRDRYIQRRWAVSFWKPNTNNTETQTT